MSKTEPDEKLVKISRETALVALDALIDRDEEDIDSVWNATKELKKVLDLKKDYNGRG